MSDAALYSTFSAMVASFAQSVGLPTSSVSFPGVGFTPPTNGMWLEFQWFPNETQNYGISDNAASILQGFAQISACYKPGGVAFPGETAKISGLTNGNRMADLIISAFGKGTEFSTARVYRKPWTNSIIQDPQRIMHPVTIMWRGTDNGV